MATKFLKTDLEGKIRNLPHFKSEALLPVFEAVINSIQAIEEAGHLSDGEIEINIIRDGQQSLDTNELPKVVSYNISDNGVGFNAENFESFETSDSIHKQSKGGKGVGRFLWLKSFATVEIDSVYEESGERFRRKFHFTTRSGIDEKSNEKTTAERRTKVLLKGLTREYAKAPSAYKTTAKIAQRILEHCLAYFVSGQAPSIVVVDSDERISLNEYYEKNIKNNLLKSDVKIGKHLFTLYHIKLYSTYDKMHNMVLCANGRDVKNVSLTRQLGTSTQFDDSHNKFTYALYVISTFLDDKVDYYRLDFDIPDEPTLYERDTLDMAQITDVIANEARKFLNEYLEKSKARKVEVIANYVENENPALRAVPHYCPEVYDEIEPNSSPEKIDEALYRFKGKAEFTIRKNSTALLKTQSTSFDEMKEAYEKLSAQINDFQKDNLVNYMLHRKRMIDLLERKLELNTDGKFSNEDIIHDIIFPRKANTDELAFEDHNLWIIDDALVFHAYAVSDKPLKETTASDNEERPDIIAFAEVDEDKIARAVSIIEFKKPQRPNFDEDPTKQVYRYLREIRDQKKMRLPNGRVLNVNETTRFYCYAICDVNAAIHRFAESNGHFALLKGELGYYMYNKALNAHTEILHFDKVVADANRRHKAYFKYLGIV